MSRSDFEGIVAEGRALRRRRRAVAVAVLAVLAAAIVTWVVTDAGDDGPSAGDEALTAGEIAGPVDITFRSDGDGDAGTAGGAPGPGFGADSQNPSLTAPPLPIGDGDPTATTALPGSSNASAASGGTGPVSSVRFRVQLPDRFDLGLPATVRVVAEVVNGQRCGSTGVSIGAVSTSTTGSTVRLAPRAAGSQTLAVSVAHSGGTCARAQMATETFAVSVQDGARPLVGPLAVSTGGAGLAQLLDDARSRWGGVSGDYRMRVDRGDVATFVTVHRGGAGGGSASARDEFGRSITPETVEDRFARVAGAIADGRPVAVRVATDTGVPLVIDLGADGRDVDEVGWFVRG